MKMRPIEMYRMKPSGTWDEMYRMKPSGTWDTVEIEIPADTSEAHLDDVAKQAAGATFGHDSAYMIYNSMEDDCPEVVPQRSEIVVKLSFDMGQTTVGTEEQQREAAIDQINMTLQRDPYGLGAILEKDDNSS